MKQAIKKFLFGSGIQEKRIRFGIAKGIKMFISLDDKSQRYLGLDEREIQTAFKAFSKQAEVFVDIGASDGYYGLVYYKFNPSGNIYLCDAAYRFAKEQADNFALNNYTTDKLHLISKYVCGINDEENISLDDLVKNVPGDIFLKIDVDGAEMIVLEGVKQVLASRNCKLIIETHSKELEDNCIHLLQQLGYKTKIISNAWWRLFIPEKRPIAHNRWFSASR